MVCRKVPGASAGCPGPPSASVKRLVAALAGFGAGWSAHQLWARLNTPLPCSPVVRPASHQEWIEWVAHYPGPFYEGPMGEWVGDLPIVEQRTEAREELGLPPWEERHGGLDPQLEFHGLPQFLRHHRDELEAVIRRRRGGNHPSSR